MLLPLDYTNHHADLLVPVRNRIYLADTPNGKYAATLLLGENRLTSLKWLGEDADFPSVSDYPRSLLVETANDPWMLPESFSSASRLPLELNGTFSLADAGQYDFAWTRKSDMLAAEIREHHAVLLRLSSQIPAATPSSIRITLLGDQFSLLLLQGNEPQFFNVFSCAGPDEILYFIAAVCREFQLQPENVSVLLFGKHATPELISQLEEYVHSAVPAPALPAPLAGLPDTGRHYSAIYSMLAAAVCE